ncbi:hypothetical protein DFH09DRAFT_1126404 [Mycena vulgaris]|nr:hypothetical protein DFH09DRAFT_1126404 [Mycena vulgaris]
MVSAAAVYLVGGWTFGICTDVFLQGVLCAQFAHYTSRTKGDTVALKLFVAGLVVLTTLRTAQALGVMWVQNVVLFENLAAASRMWFTSWLEEINLILEAVIAFYVQVFLCHRLWAISRNIYVVALSMCLFTFALGSGGIETFVMFTNQEGVLFDWVAVHLATTFFGDLLLTGSTTLFLLQHSKDVLPRGQTATLLNSLLRLTIQSAAPAALCAFINLVCSQVGRKTDVANARMMVAIIANLALPKLYAISAMWTLNSREGIRAAAEPSSRATYTMSLGTVADPEIGGCPDGGDEGEVKSATLRETEIIQLQIPKSGRKNA